MQKKISVLIALVFAAYAQWGVAGDTYWTGPSGSFQNSGSWSAGIPGAADNARFANNASYTVTWNGGATNANAYFDMTAAGGSVTQAIGNYTWKLTSTYKLGSTAGKFGSIRHVSGNLIVTNAGAKITIGDAGKGQYVLEQGSVTGSTALGYNTGGNSLTLSGTNAQWNGFTSALYEMSMNSIAGCVSNRLTIINGASMTVVGGYFPRRGRYNTVEVSGSNSLLKVTGGEMYISQDGLQNEMIVSNGGQVSSAANNLLGKFAAAVSNKVTITGSGSQWTGNLNAAAGNDNMITVSNGGKIVGGFSLSAPNGLVSRNALLLTGPNSSIVGPNAVFGESGGGTRATISDGALLRTTSRFAIIGQGSAAKSVDNQVLLTGSNTLWHATFLLSAWEDCFWLGGYGQGGNNLLTISNQATLRVVGPFNVGANLGIVNSNRLVIAGGSLYATNVAANANTTIWTAYNTFLMQGSGGKAVVNNLVMSDRTNTLSFVADVNGVTPITVTGNLTIPASNKLVVDLTKYKWGNYAPLVLVTYGGTRTGTFGETKITVTGLHSGVTQGDGSNDAIVVLPPPRGTTIMIR